LPVVAILLLKFEGFAYKAATAAIYRKLAIFCSEAPFMVFLLVTYLKVYCILHEFLSKE
jgi:hypothetical protein